MLPVWDHVLLDGALVWKALGCMVPRFGAILVLGSPFWTSYFEPFWCSRFESDLGAWFRCGTLFSCAQRCPLVHSLVLERILVLFRMVHRFGVYPSPCTKMIQNCSAPCTEMRPFLVRSAAFWGLFLHAAPVWPFLRCAVLGVILVQSAPFWASFWCLVSRFGAYSGVQCVWVCFFFGAG